MPCLCPPAPCPPADPHSTHKSAWLSSLGTLPGEPSCCPTSSQGPSLEESIICWRYLGQRGSGRDKGSSQARVLLVSDPKGGRLTSGAEGWRLCSGQRPWLLGSALQRDPVSLALPVAVPCMLETTVLHHPSVPWASSDTPSLPLLPLNPCGPAGMPGWPFQGCPL